MPGGFWQRGMDDVRVTPQDLHVIDLCVKLDLWTRGCKISQKRGKYDVIANRLILLQHELALHVIPPAQAR